MRRAWVVPLVIASVVGSMFAIGSSSSGAAPAAKPDKATVKVCTVALQQGYHSIAHAADIANVLVDVTTANAKFYAAAGNGGGTETDVQSWLDAQTTAVNTVNTLAPQVEEAVTGYDTAATKCAKALGIKASALEVPPTTAK